MRGKDKLQSCEMQQFPSTLTETVLGAQKLLSCPEHSFSHGTSKGRNTYIYIYINILNHKSQIVLVNVTWLPATQH